MSITNFGTLQSGEIVRRVTIGNGHLSASFLTLGAILQDVRLRGVEHPLTLGSPDMAAYDDGPFQYHGAIVGPVANRISGATASINGQAFEFDKNVNGAHTLHSGSGATHTRVWDVENSDETSVTFRLELADGLGGFPGNRVLRVAFSIENSALTMRLTATTDAPTWINAANHSYWNLDGRETFEGHVLQIAADSYLPTSDEFVPTGEIRDVTGSEFDFREGRALRPNEPFLDHNFCLGNAKRDLTFAARLTGKSGVSMMIETTDVGLQIYDGWTLDTAPFNGHDGTPDKPYCGVAFEAQGWPNAANNPNFPSWELHPEKPHEQITRWTFLAP